MHSTIPPIPTLPPAASSSEPRPRDAVQSANSASHSDPSIPLPQTRSLPPHPFVSLPYPEKDSQNSGVGPTAVSATIGPVRFAHPSVIIPTSSSLPSAVTPSTTSPSTQPRISPSATKKNTAAATFCSPSNRRDPTIASQDRRGPSALSPTRSRSCSLTGCVVKTENSRLESGSSPTPDDEDDGPDPASPDSKIGKFGPVPGSGTNSVRGPISPEPSLDNNAHPPDNELDAHSTLADAVSGPSGPPSPCRNHAPSSDKPLDSSLIQTKPAKKAPGRRRAPNPNVSVEADLRRQLALRASYRSVVRALKPVLNELASRTIQNLKDDASYHLKTPDHQTVLAGLSHALDRRVRSLRAHHDFTTTCLKRVQDGEVESAHRRFRLEVEELREVWLTRCKRALADLHAKECREVLGETPVRDLDADLGTMTRMVDQVIGVMKRPESPPGEDTKTEVDEGDDGDADDEDDLLLEDILLQHDDGQDDEEEEEMDPMYQEPAIDRATLIPVLQNRVVNRISNIVPESTLAIQYNSRTGLFRETGALISDRVAAFRVNRALAAFYEENPEFVGVEMVERTKAEGEPDGGSAATSELDIAAVPSQEPDLKAPSTSLDLLLFVADRLFAGLDPECGERAVSPPPSLSKPEGEATAAPTVAGATQSGTVSTPSSLSAAPHPPSPTIADLSSTTTSQRRTRRKTRRNDGVDPKTKSSKSMSRAASNLSKAEPLGTGTHPNLPPAPSAPPALDRSPVGSTMKSEAGGAEAVPPALPDGRLETPFVCRSIPSSFAAHVTPAPTATVVQNQGGSKTPAYASRPLAAASKLSWMLDNSDEPPIRSDVHARFSVSTTSPPQSGLGPSVYPGPPAVATTPPTSSGQPTSGLVTALSSPYSTATSSLPRLPTTVGLFEQPTNAVTAFPPPHVPAQFFVPGPASGPAIDSRMPSLKAILHPRPEAEHAPSGPAPVQSYAGVDHQSGYHHPHHPPQHQPPPLAFLPPSQQAQAPVQTSTPAGASTVNENTSGFQTGFAAQPPPPSQPQPHSAPAPQNTQPNSRSGPRRANRIADLLNPNPVSPPPSQAPPSRPAPPPVQGPQTPLAHPSGPSPQLTRARNASLSSNPGPAVGPSSLQAIHVPPTAALRHGGPGTEPLPIQPTVYPYPPAAFYPSRENREMVGSQAHQGNRRPECRVQPIGPPPPQPSGSSSRPPSGPTSATSAPLNVAPATGGVPPGSFEPSLGSSMWHPVPHIGEPSRPAPVASTQQAGMKRERTELSERGDGPSSKWVKRQHSIYDGAPSPRTSHSMLPNQHRINQDQRRDHHPIQSAVTATRPLSPRGQNYHASAYNPQPRMGPPALRSGPPESQDGTQHMNAYGQPPPPPPQHLLFHSYPSNPLGPTQYQADSYGPPYAPSEPPPGPGSTAADQGSAGRKMRYDGPSYSSVDAIHSGHYHGGPRPLSVTQFGKGSSLGRKDQPYEPVGSSYRVNHSPDRIRVAETGNRGRADGDRSENARPVSPGPQARRQPHNPPLHQPAPLPPPVKFGAQWHGSNGYSSPKISNSFLTPTQPTEQERAGNEFSQRHPMASPAPPIPPQPGAHQRQPSLHHLSGPLDSGSGRTFGYSDAKLRHQPESSRHHGRDHPPNYPMTRSPSGVDRDRGYDRTYPGQMAPPPPPSLHLHPVSHGVHDGSHRPQYPSQPPPASPGGQSHPPSHQYGSAYPHPPPMDGSVSGGRRSPGPNPPVLRQPPTGSHPSSLPHPYPGPPPPPPPAQARGPASHPPGLPSHPYHYSYSQHQPAANVAPPPMTSNSTHIHSPQPTRSFGGPRTLAGGEYGGFPPQMFPPATHSPSPVSAHPQSMMANGPPSHGSDITPHGQRPVSAMPSSSASVRGYGGMPVDHRFSGQYSQSGPTQQQGSEGGMYGYPGGDVRGRNSEEDGRRGAPWPPSQPAARGRSRRRGARA